MAYSFSDLRGMVFVPLSEAKAKLSEFMRRIASRGERVAVTTNGRPTAVMLPYEEYLRLLGSGTGEEEGSEDVVSLDDWKKKSGARKRVSSSIRNLFNYDSLPRKGKKSYKKDLLDDLDR